MRQIILASGSPRRKQLLADVGVAFDVIPSKFDEYLDDDRSPAEVTMELGLGKAMDVAKDHPDAIVIGSDTIVTIEGKQLGKAATLDEAREMIKLESGKLNLISSSLAVVCLAEQFQAVEVSEAKIFFKPYNHDAVETYLQSGDYKDKAGAYGVQSGAAPLVDYIVGRYDTILGMPTDLLVPILRKFGIEAREAAPVPPEELVFK